MVKSLTLWNRNDINQPTHFNRFKFNLEKKTIFSSLGNQKKKKETQCNWKWNRKIWSTIKKTKKRLCRGIPNGFFFYYFYTQSFLWAALIIYYFFFFSVDKKNIVNFFFFLTSKVGKYATRDYLNYENERWGDSWNDLLVGRDFFLFLCENKLIY